MWVFLEKTNIDENIRGKVLSGSNLEHYRRIRMLCFRFCVAAATSNAMSFSFTFGSKCWSRGVVLMCLSWAIVPVQPSRMKTRR
jgi:hypothetical protein